MGAGRETGALFSEMRILVCGGRDFRNYGFLDNILSTHVGKVTEVVHGAAPGADSLAGRWASENGVYQEVYPAEWDKYGKRAGPIRNQQMLDVAKPDKVIAFPGGRGTADMISRARAAGLPVVEIK